MPYRKLTDLGKEFINDACKKNNLLSGKNKFILPYSTPKLDKVWSCKFKYNDAEITESNLPKALINWFEIYSQMYDLDANVIAAQAYVESGYVMWQYAEKTTASGVSQLEMLEIFGIIVNNEGNATKMTQGEIDAITNGLTEPLVRNSYDVLSKTPQTAYTNHPILHQNVINNPEIMIKAQCRYMRILADLCDDLASTTLFCYNTDKAFASNTFSKALNKCKNKNAKNETYYNAACDYVLRIFGILGDKDNAIKPLPTPYKTSGKYFGYDKGEDNTNLKLLIPFSAYDANVTESDEFNLVGYNDIVVENLSKTPNYKFIYYPETDYIQEKTDKTQIVLHHTVSGDNVAGDILWWEQQVSKTGSSSKVATAFIVDRRGGIYQLFSTDFWAYHLGISETVIKDNNLSGNANRTLNEHSIGIEIDNWGGLINSGGYWYPSESKNYEDKTILVANTKVAPIENVVEYNASNGYPEGYHGFYAFEMYTPAQIEAVKTIIYAIKKKFTAIPLTYVNELYPNTDMWGTYSNGKWQPAKESLNGKPGIWTHVSYRYDKSDCQPQNDLVEMLKSL